MEITLNTTFDLADDLTLEVSNVNGKIVGTLIIKNGNINYHDFELDKVIDYGQDVDRFVFNAEDEGLSFRKISAKRFIEFQPNPKKNNTGDCSFRAYAKAQNITWDEAFDIAVKHAKEMNLMPNDHKVVDKILTSEFGFKFHKFTKDDKKKTVNEFAVENPVGTFIAWMHGHVVTIVNGYYYDSWDSGDRKMKGYYYKEE